MLIKNKEFIAVTSIPLIIGVYSLYMLKTGNFWMGFSLFITLSTICIWVEGSLEIKKPEPKNPKEIVIEGAKYRLVE